MDHPDGPFTSTEALMEVARLRAVHLLDGWQRLRTLEMVADSEGL